MANYRLNESMESRIHREVYVRFGGELSKSRHSNMKMGVGSLAYDIRSLLGGWCFGRFCPERHHISLSAHCSDVDSVEDNSLAADFHHHAQYRGTKTEQLHATRTAQTRLQILPTLRQPQIHTRIECETASVSCRQ